MPRAVPAAGRAAQGAGTAAVSTAGDIEDPAVLWSCPPGQLDGCIVVAAGYPVRMVAEHRVCVVQD